MTRIELRSVLDNYTAIDFLYKYLNVGILTFGATEMLNTETVREPIIALL